MLRAVCILSGSWWIVILTVMSDEFNMVLVCARTLTSMQCQCYVCLSVIKLSEGQNVLLNVTEHQKCKPQSIQCFSGECQYMFY